MRQRVIGLPRKRKPRILLLVDYRGWAYDHSAKALAKELAGDFDFEIKYVTDSPKPRLNPRRYDLIYVFFWGESFHTQFGFAPERTIKGISSHRWEHDPKFGPCSPGAMAERFLKDARTAFCTSKRLHRIFSQIHPRSFHIPNGVQTECFKPIGGRSGPIRVGWAGNIIDPVKQVEEILKPACDGSFELLLAPGELSHEQMNEFYNEIDVFAVASVHEGEPLTLIEAMAAGCFPVCTNVGVVPELIRHLENGYIVDDHDAKAFNRAFHWCDANSELVRRAGRENSGYVHQYRDWRVTAQFFKAAFHDTLEYVHGKRG